MQSAPTWQFFPVGIREVKEEPSRFKRLLRKLHLIPKSSTSEKVPVFYGENTYYEYVKRIKELGEEP